MDIGMEDTIGRRAPNEARIRVRARTLMQREIEHAQRQGFDRIRCPCNIHVRQQRSTLTINSYRKCLARNGRHPWFYGRSEGYEADESDVEWDAHIQWYHGARAGEGLRRDHQQRLDQGIDIVEMITETYDLADRISEEAARGRDENERPVSPGAEQTLPNREAVPECEDEDMSPRDSIASSLQGTTNFASDEGHQALHAEEEVGNDFQRDEDSQPQDCGMPATDAAPNREYESSSSNDSELDWGDSDDETESSIRALEEAAASPLFEGSELSSMGTTYLLLNSGKLHSCTDVYMDELFRILSKSVLPKPNSLPSSYRQASLYVKRLGHSYKSYDICPDNYKLFRNELKDAQSCPKCRAPRKKRAGKSMVPHKVLRAFPVTPRLKRIFRSPVQAAAMTWHAMQRNDDGLMKHVSHSKQWKWINERYAKEFAYDDRCIRLALIADGFNPSSDKRNIWNILYGCCEVQGIVIFYSTCYGYLDHR